LGGPDARPFHQPQVRIRQARLLPPVFRHDGDIGLGLLQRLQVLPEVGGMATVAQDSQPGHRPRLQRDAGRLAILIEDQELREQMAAQALEDIRARWNWECEEAGGEWLEIYRMLAE
jgi:hypothetical protein